MSHLTFANISQLVDEQETKYQRQLRNEVDLNELNTQLHTPFSNDRYGTQSSSSSSDDVLVNIFSFLLPNVCESIEKQEQAFTMKKDTKRGKARTDDNNCCDDDRNVVAIKLVCKRWLEMWSYCIEFHQWFLDWNTKRRKKMKAGRSSSSDDFSMSASTTSSRKRNQKKKSSKKELYLSSEESEQEDNDDSSGDDDDDELNQKHSNNLRVNKKTTVASIKTNISMFELPKCFYELPIDRNSVVLDERIPLVTVSLIYPCQFKFTLWRSVLSASVFAAKSHESKLSDYQYSIGSLTEEYDHHDDDDGGSSGSDGEGEELESDDAMIDSLVELPRNGNFSGLYHSIVNNGVMMMITHGGYYAGARFAMNNKHVATGGIEQKEHKTFHKYVVRKKQGKRQVNQDKSKRAKSVGSEMRRLNEKHFKDQLQEHILEWTDLFSDGDTIVFTHAPGHYNRSLLFKIPDHPSPIRPSSCFSIPFATGSQPNNTQLQQAAQKMFQIQLEL